jgi:chromosome segregation ATPase
MYAKCCYSNTLRTSCTQYKTRKYIQIAPHETVLLNLHLSRLVVFYWHMAIKKKTASAGDALGEAIASDIPKPAEIMSKSAALAALKSQLTDRISGIFDALEKEIIVLNDLKKRTEEELAIMKNKARQEAEEEKLTSILERRKKQAEFDEKLSKEKSDFETEMGQKEAALKARIDEISKTEADIKLLREESQKFATRLEKTAEESAKQTASDLKKDFEIEKKMLLQKYESDLKLQNQQIVSIQNQIKQQEKEILSLKAEKTRTVEQMKDLAVAIVRGKESGQAQLPPSQSL